MKIFLKKSKQEVEADVVKTNALTVWLKLPSGKLIKKKKRYIRG